VDRQKFEELQAAYQPGEASDDASDGEGTPSLLDGETGRPAGSTGARLIQWLDANGADSRKLSLREYAPEVRGVHSDKVLVPGERILVIPKKCLITVEMGKMTEIGQKLLQHNLEFVAPKHIFLMMWLLTDMERVRMHSISGWGKQITCKY
jgi:hypothetical protein